MTRLSFMPVDEGYFFFPPSIKKNLQFWDVCSMDHLLARLAIDSHSVSKRIVDLLFKSFFPVNESEKEWCCRCITLIQMNPMAARKFYHLAHRHTAPTNISEYKLDDSTKKNLFLMLHFLPSLLPFKSSGLMCCSHVPCHLFQ